MHPFLLTPAFKDYIWGGTKLRDRYHKQTELTPVAESWELSTHPDGETLIASGEKQGMTLAALLKEQPGLVGRAARPDEPFPVLIKLIDAAQSLSVQVHPDDAFAKVHENGLGKTEMWYILDCEPGAFLYLGFERELTQEEFRRRIAENTLTEVLHKAYVRPGEAYFIQAGTVHAIGSGIVLAEVQQNSNTTYRVYDFGRVGKDGKPRELHVEKAAQVLKLAPAEFAAPGARADMAVPGGTLATLASCNYFATDRVRLMGEYRREMDGESYVCVLCTEGACTLSCGGETLELERGACAFAPADCGGFTLSGKGELLFTSLGKRK